MRYANVPARMWLNDAIPTATTAAECVVHSGPESPYKNNKTAKIRIVFLLFFWYNGQFKFDENDPENLFVLATLFAPDFCNKKNIKFFLLKNPKSAQSETETLQK